MTAAPLTYMVADIVASSTIMLKDQRRETDLYETFQSILVPIIEKAVGFGIEFTGDAISASFRSCKSAVNTGFAIQTALKKWNLSSVGPGITARIGIHFSKPSEDKSLQQLSLAAATSLQSLGRADALCVSRNIIDEMASDEPVYAYPMGRHDLGFLPDTVSVFYLYEEKQAFLRRQGFLLEYLKTEYLVKIRSSVIPSAVEIPTLVVATLLFLAFISSKPMDNAQIIEVEAVRHLGNGVVNEDLSGLHNRIQKKVNAMSKFSRLHFDENSKSKLILSLQENDDQIRVTWGVFQQDGAAQIAGGVETGNITGLVELERKIIDNILVGLSD